MIQTKSNRTEQPELCSLRKRKFNNLGYDDSYKRHSGASNISFDRMHKA